MANSSCQIYMKAVVLHNIDHKEAKEKTINSYKDLGEGLKKPLLYNRRREQGHEQVSHQKLCYLG